MLVVLGRRASRIATSATTTHRDVFQTSNVYGVSAAGYAYGHALSSSFPSTGIVGYSTGYGVGVGSYGARRGGVAMKMRWVCRQHA